MHTDWSSFSLCFFNCDDLANIDKKPTNSPSQQIRILHKTNKKNIFSELLAFWEVC